MNTQSKFFVKTDDDSFVRVDTLSLELLTSYQADTPTLIGAIKPHAIVDHTGARTSGRNKELPEYKPDVYPPWAAGNNGHAVSRPIAQYVSDKRYAARARDPPPSAAPRSPLLCARAPGTTSSSTRGRTRPSASGWTRARSRAR